MTRGCGQKGDDMYMRSGSFVTALAFLAASASGAAAAPTRCASLRGRNVGGARIVSAVTFVPGVPATRWLAFEGAPPVHRAFCRVFARVDQVIGYELWLPDPAHWNRRFLGAGVGGSAGTYNFRELAIGVERGFAVASTDTGHLASNVHWMLNATAAADYAYRGVHRMTSTAKAIVDAYYGRRAAHAYFTGCSGGGREGLKELQRYPSDYDGILAGAPGPNMPLLSVRHMLSGLWQQRSGITIADSDWHLVQRQAVRACDKLDGLADGVVEDPRRCHVNLDELLCRAGQTEGCLTPAKLALVKRIVGPIRDAAGTVYDTGLLPGVRSRPGPPPALVAQLFGDGAHHDPNWNPLSFDPAADLAAVYREQPELRADDPDVGAFDRHGGKLILYQGWMDPSVIAQQSVDYFKRLVARSGGAAVASRFARLYMVPGMYHCRGGDSTDRFGGEAGSVVDDPRHDALSALIAWRESGRAPGALIAAKVAGGRVVRTRPLCPFPERAAYRGGPAGAASSFACVAPSGRPDRP